MKRALNHTEINDENAEIGFAYKNYVLTFVNNSIVAMKHNKIIAEYGLKTFTKSPSAVVRSLLNDLSEKVKV